MAGSCGRGEDRRRFTGEFKADAVALVIEGAGRFVPARDLCVGETNQGNRVCQVRSDRGEQPGPAR